jgi:RNA recognition motif-containing protein
MNLYVGNLNYDMSEEELRTAFAEHGDVQSAKIITDKFTGRSRGFGFVEMASEEAGNAAMENLNGKDVGGRQLVVNEARPRR